LIVPRRSITGLAALKPDDSGLLNEVIEIVKSLVISLDLESSGYRLIVNGGKYQEFPQLHFHLVSDGGLQ
jgi:diadenosine tetraphosphate (Ap4A) HIT family hydrolase